MHDDSFIRQARARDADAFTYLIKKYELSMYKAAKAILGNDDDAADAMQSAVLTCWEKIDTLREDKYFRTWLMRILINACYSILRKSAPAVSLENEEQGHTESSYETAEWKLFLSILPEKLRIVTELYYIEGCKVREIAEILDLPANTVKTRLAQARKQMRAALAENGSSELQNKDGRRQ